jgi:hypothetical protein
LRHARAAVQGSHAKVLRKSASFDLDAFAAEHMMFLSGLLIGFFIGSLFGFFLAALAHVIKSDR